MKDWGRLVHRTVITITECRKNDITSAKGSEYNLGDREFGVGG